MVHLSLLCSTILTITVFCSSYAYSQEKEEKDIKPTPPGNSYTETENVVSGSWATLAGGTLEPANLEELNCTNFSEGRFSRVKRPVGLGVIHEYIGVSIKKNDPTSEGEPYSFDYYVTGLNNESDQDFFVEHFDDDHWTNTASARNYDIKSCTDFKRLVSGINDITKSTPYRDMSIYTGSIVVTPILGQPCSNVANQIEIEIKNFLKKKRKS